jgi:hypothetical protein
MPYTMHKNNLKPTATSVMIIHKDMATQRHLCKSMQVHSHTRTDHVSLSVNRINICALNLKKKKKKKYSMQWQYTGETTIYCIYCCDHPKLQSANYWAFSSIVKTLYNQQELLSNNLRMLHRTICVNLQRQMTSNQIKSNHMMQSKQRSWR